MAQLNRISLVSLIALGLAMPAMAQKYHCPMWQVPNAQLDNEDNATVSGNRSLYQATQERYHSFVTDLLERLKSLN